MLDSQSAGRFSKRAQNTTPHKTHLQTDLYDTTNCPFGEPDGANVQTRPRPQSVSQEWRIQGREVRAAARVYLPESE